ncbi:lysozyme [Haloechinothrix aidingensis]
MASVLATSALLISSTTHQAAHAADDKDTQVRAHSTPMGSQIERVEGSERDSAKDAKDDKGDKGKADASRDSDVRGIDVSGWQQDVDWQHWWDEGKRFAFVKATEGTGYTNPYFPQQYNGSYDVGMIRGAYHFARPDRSSGAAQANFFVDNGGMWSGDGKTLPGAADLEYNPYGEDCYDKSESEMVDWIQDFHDTYADRTGRYPIFYTSTSWWEKCVGDSHDFGETAPLWIARYSSRVGELPSGWHYYSFWQYTDDPIDKNEFNGTRSQLRAVATG